MNAPLPDQLLLSAALLLFSQSDSCHLRAVYILLQACERYATALDVCPNAHAVLYNWGVALSDLARLAKVKTEALTLDGSGGRLCCLIHSTQSACFFPACHAPGWPEGIQ